MNEGTELGYSDGTTGCEPGVVPVGALPRLDSMPVRHHMKSPEWYESLDAGIRFAVKVLHSYGIETGQSCEGGDGHCYDHPSVDLLGGSSDDGEGFAALHALTQYGLSVATVEYVWNVTAGAPFDSFWRLTFRAPLHDHADREPSFIRHYQWNTRLAEGSP